MILAQFYSRIRSLLNSENRRLVTRESLKAMLGAMRGTELEQAGLRVLIGGAVMAYLAMYLFLQGAPQGQEREVLVVSIAFFLFGLVLVFRVVAHPEGSPLRRAVAMVADNAVTSYCLIRMGEGGAVVLFVYLFI